MQKSAHRRKGMIKRYRFLFFCIPILFCAIWLFAKTYVVKIQTTHLREQPKFYAKTLAVLEAGDGIETLEIQDGWMKVRTEKGLVGWLHSSSVAEKKFSLFGTEKTLKTQAAGDEVALAAKGFNKQVEEKYRASHPELNFNLVDEMAQTKIPLSELHDFLKQGKLGEFRRSQ